MDFGVHKPFKHEFICRPGVLLLIIVFPPLLGKRFPFMFYYILFAMFYLMSLLPLVVLRGIGRFLCFVVYRGFGYRRQVVMTNLKNAFPEKSHGELKRIAARSFYNFFDTWMELIKCTTMTKRTADRIMTADYSLLKELYAQGKTVQFMCGHQFNWELYNMVVPPNQPFSFLAVYMPMGNATFDRLVAHIRSRMGTVLIPATQIKLAMQPWLGKQYMIALGADQRPGHPENGYWLNYLNQPAPVVGGPAKNAKTLNCPIVFAQTTKLPGGKYRLQFELLMAEPAHHSLEEITIAYVRRLEQAVQAQPENYLWTHKRWKHPWRAAYAPLWIDNAPLPLGE